MVKKIGPTIKCDDTFHDLTQIINIIHCLHDFAHKQDSQLNSLVLITVWRVVIEV